eukprot:872982-Pleurochrysis_carterae.AAC.7
MAATYLGKRSNFSFVNITSSDVCITVTFRQSSSQRVDPASLTEPKITQLHVHSRIQSVPEYDIILLRVSLMRNITAGATASRERAGDLTRSRGSSTPRRPGDHAARRGGACCALRCPCPTVSLSSPLAAVPAGSLSSASKCTTLNTSLLRIL